MNLHCNTCNQPIDECLCAFNAEPGVEEIFEWDDELDELDDHLEPVQWAVRPGYPNVSQEDSFYKEGRTEPAVDPDEL